MMRAIEVVSIVFRFYFMSRYWKESWSKIINKVLTILGAFWLLISLIEFFFPSNSPIPRDPIIFWFLFATSALASIITTIPPLNIVEKVEGKDISIRLIIGNLFNQKGDIVIPSNSTFDTTFEKDFISHNSIQGQLFSREYDKLEHLDQEIATELSGVQPSVHLERKNSKNERYAIGTTIKLNHRSGIKTYWIALADINEHGKPEGKFENLQICLESLWSFIGEKGHMVSLVMPVLGSGKTGINEKRLTILKEIIFSFVAMTNERKITEELILCIHPSDISSEKINIYELNQYLKFLCKYRYEPTNSNSSSQSLS